MACWVCGAPNVTGEHLVKASALRALFGEMKPGQPLHFTQHVTNRGVTQVRHRKMQGINSKLVKLNVLCARCNGAVTQKSDLAFDALLLFLFQNAHSLRRGKRIRLHRVFRTAVRRQALAFHLYAVKLMGCVAAHKNIPLDVAELASAIRNHRATLRVHVVLGTLGGPQDIVSAGPTDVQADIDPATGKCIFAAWSLGLGEWTFQFFYIEPGHGRVAPPKAWHPSNYRRFPLEHFG
jgi:hypothetical protein